MPIMSNVVMTGRRMNRPVRLIGASLVRGSAASGGARSALRAALAWQRSLASDRVGAGARAHRDASARRQPRLPVGDHALAIIQAARDDRDLPRGALHR